MKSRRPRLLLAIAALVIVPLFGPTASMQQAPKRPIEVEDVVSWKGLGFTVLSNDGQWFGYRLAPQEGDAEVVIKAEGAGSKLQAAHLVVDCTDSKVSEADAIHGVDRARKELKGRFGLIRIIGRAFDLTFWDLKGKL